MWQKMREWLGIVTVLGVLVGLPVVIKIYHNHVVETAYGEDAQIIDLYASADGGKWIAEPVIGANYWWRTFQNCDTISVEVGRPVVFRITSADVLHSFAIPGIREWRRPIDIEAGKWRAVEFTPEEEDVISFLCWQFCSEHHESMHGEIEVTEQDGSAMLTSMEAN
jgi:heme/copper-type cytochrome/quinol oxidase subunit 2